MVSLNLVASLSLFASFDLLVSLSIFKLLRYFRHLCLFRPPCLRMNSRGVRGCVLEVSESVAFSYSDTPHILPSLLSFYSRSSGLPLPISWMLVDNWLISNRLVG